MSLDQVVNADAEEELASEDEDEVFFQDIFRFWVCYRDPETIG